MLSQTNWTGKSQFHLSERRALWVYNEVIVIMKIIKVGWILDTKNNLEWHKIQSSSLNQFLLVGFLKRPFCVHFKPKLIFSFRKLCKMS